MKKRFNQIIKKCFYCDKKLHKTYIYKNKFIPVNIFLCKNCYKLKKENDLLLNELKILLKKLT